MERTDEGDNEWKVEGGRRKGGREGGRKEEAINRNS